MFNKNIIETNCCNTNRIADIDDNQAAKELNRNCPDFNSYAALWTNRNQHESQEPCSYAMYKCRGSFKHV